MSRIPSAPIRLKSLPRSLSFSTSKRVHLRSLSDVQTPDTSALNVKPVSKNRSSSQGKSAWTGPTQTTLSVTPTQLTLSLPVPPSINHQYATVNGRRVLSSTGRKYKTSVAEQIFIALTTTSHRRALLQNLHTHSLGLSIQFYFTSALRRDLDGGLKIAQDSICDALEINDNRILEIHLYKAIDAVSPRMECTLSIKHPLPKPAYTKTKKIPRHRRGTSL